MITNFESKITPLYSADPRIKVGRFTYGSPKFKLWAEYESVIIGAFCSIADDVVIFGGGEHRHDWVTTFPLRIALGDPLAGKDGHPATKGETRIGNDVWVGYGATIMSGVTIGDGAVIGARALVSKDVPPYSIAAGNPAQCIRKRFTEEQIDALVKIRWWQWPVEKIYASQDELCGGKIDDFIQKYV